MCARLWSVHMAYAISVILCVYTVNNTHRNNKRYCAIIYDGVYSISLIYKHMHHSTPHLSSNTSVSLGWDFITERDCVYLCWLNDDDEMGAAGCYRNEIVHWIFKCHSVILWEFNIVSSRHLIKSRETNNSRVRKIKKKWKNTQRGDLISIFIQLYGANILLQYKQLLQFGEWYGWAVSVSGCVLDTGDWRLKTGVHVCKSKKGKRILFAFNFIVCLLRLFFFFLTQFQLFFVVVESLDTHKNKTRMGMPFIHFLLVFNLFAVFVLA